LLHQVGDLFELNVKLRCQNVKNGSHNIQSKRKMLKNAQQSQVLRYISDICISRKGKRKVTQLIGLGAATCFKNIRDIQRGKITQ